MATDRYRQRTPRLRFSESNKAWLRWATLESRGAGELVEAMDLSQTGLSFRISKPEANRLDEGDVIKLEFIPPGREPIACFGTVVRVDVLNAWNPEFGESAHVKVAIEFRHLPSAHERALELALVPLIGRTELDTSLRPARRFHAAELAEIAVCSLALFAAIFALAAPWAQWIALLSARLS